MNDNDYVLKHDYGYGQEQESKELNKLTLRNYNDLKVYLEDNLPYLYNADVVGRRVKFNDSDETFEVVIEVI